MSAKTDEIKVKSFYPPAIAKNDPKNTFKALHTVAEWGNVFFPCIKDSTQTWISTFKQISSSFYIIDLGDALGKVFGGKKVSDEDKDKTKKDNVNNGLDLAAALCDTISNAYKSTEFLCKASLIFVSKSLFGRFSLVGNSFLVFGSALRIYQEASKLLKYRNQNEPTKFENGERLLNIRKRYAMVKMVKSIALLVIGILVIYGTLYTFPVIPLLIVGTINMYSSFAKDVLEQTYGLKEEDKSSKARL